MKGTAHPLLVLVLGPLLPLALAAAWFASVWTEEGLDPADAERWAARAAEVCPADALLVMGAAQYDGVPSDAFERRLSAALRLTELGCAPRVVVSGGRQEGDRTTEGEAGVAWLAARGAAAELVAETRAATTVENLRFAADALPDARWVVVTDDLHAVRTRTAAGRLGLAVEVVGVRTRVGRWPYALREVAGLAGYRFGAFR